MLEVKNLKKIYDGNVEAVKDISLRIEKGQCFGLLGPNGAGKSTTIEMIEGIKTPSSGEILWNGKEVDQSFKEIIGIQFQSTELQDLITVREALSMFASFYQGGLEIDEIVGLCHLEEYLDQYTNKISGGQRQRLLVGIALIHDPEIVFLDEPTTGLDPQSRRNFWDLINGIKKRNKTIILTTHYMEEAYQLCDEIAIVDKGLIISQGNPKELLREHYRGAHISFDLAEKENMPNDFEFSVKDDRISFHTNDVNLSLSTLISNNVNLSSIEIHKQNLEDLFVDITGKQLRD